MGHTEEPPSKTDSLSATRDNNDIASSQAMLSKQDDHNAAAIARVHPLDGLNPAYDSEMELTTTKEEYDPVVTSLATLQDPVWTSDSWTSAVDASSSCRLFERTCPASATSATLKLEDRARTRVVPLSACAFELESKRTNNQDDARTFATVDADADADVDVDADEDEDDNKMQRSWSAPPLPTQFEDFFSQSPLHDEMQHLSLSDTQDADLDGKYRDSSTALWATGNDNDSSSTGTITPTSASPTALAASALKSEELQSNDPVINTSSNHHRHHSSSHAIPTKRSSFEMPPVPMTMPMPMLSKPPTQKTQVAGGTNPASDSRLHVGSRIAASAAGYAQSSLYGPGPPSTCSNHRWLDPPSYPHGELRSLDPSVHSKCSTASFSAPPGFGSPYSLASDLKPSASCWRAESSAFSSSIPARSSLPSVPTELIACEHRNRSQSLGARMPKIGGIYNSNALDRPPMPFGSVNVSSVPIAPSMPATMSISPASNGFRYMEGSSLAKSIKLHQPRPRAASTAAFEFVPVAAHSYSSRSLLEEFKSASKADKWDLSTIQGHLVQFAHDQSGSRFIQQKLEKADERSFALAFEEVAPHALTLMTDVFGNYVIQKLFDHGSPTQQQLLVDRMIPNLIRLVLQTYGCRVIQKALEVCQPDVQLQLIHQLHGHVVPCVMDQNGNHVIQKCIEAASCSAHAPRNGVTGNDIQFILDAFQGQAASLSTHPYGCRVLQRVLEHCASIQVRPLVQEIIAHCHDLVKDQFGNYVVQHVISYGEPEQRNIVMQTIIPEIAKWSQHKYASNVVEACLMHATKAELRRIVDYMLRADASGSSCPLLPMMKHMYGNYVVQKLLDMVDPRDCERIVCIIQHNADYLRRFTYGKHVLSRLDRLANSRSAGCASAGDFYA